MHQNEAQKPIRIDFQASENHSIVGRYMLTTDDRQIHSTQPTATSWSRTRGADDRAHNLTVGHTWVIGPTMVNSSGCLPTTSTPTSLDRSSSGHRRSASMPTPLPGYMRLIVNNAFNLGSGSFTSNLYTKIQNAGVSDDFT